MAPPILSRVAQLFPDALFYAPVREKMVALTIDDIPTPGDPHDLSTRLILQAISDYNRTAKPPAQATFFVITDHLNAGSSLLPDILAEGHEVANHGTSDTTPAMLEPVEFQRHFQEAHDLLTDTIQQPIRWYRPGRGLYNRAMVEHVRLTPGYESLVALASMIPFDTMQPLSTPNLNTWYLSQFIFSGAIFVIHGGSIERCVQTSQALPPLLRAIADQGYQVVTLSQLYDQFIAETALGKPPPHPPRLQGPPSPPLV